MTLIEAIGRVDAVKPNSYSQTQKTAWLSDLDGIIKNNIIDTHEGGEVTFSGYSESTSLDTVLLVSAPYEEIYIHWLESKIDYANGEYGKYNNSSIAFNDIFSEFKRYYKRMHMPKGAKLKFF